MTERETSVKSNRSLSRGGVITRILPDVSLQFPQGRGINKYFNVLKVSE